MLGRALLISVRLEHAEGILSGGKTVELRRTRPRVSRGDWVFIYVPTPRKELVGAFEVADVIAKGPSDLWRQAGSR